MTALLTIARCLLLGLVPCAVADDAGKEPVEVDFAPLPLPTQTDYTLDYTFTTHGDTGLTGVVHMTTETPSEARDYFKRKLERDGWVVKAEGKTKLIVYAQGDHAPRKVEFKVDTFEFKPKGDATPIVRRLPKKA